MYNIKVKALDCASPRVAVPVQPLASVAATILANSSTTICAGDSVVLAASVPAGMAFQWQKDGILLPNVTQPTYAATQSGNYTVAMFNGACVIPYN